MIDMETTLVAIIEYLHNIDQNMEGVLWFLELISRSLVNITDLLMYAGNVAYEYFMNH